MPKPASSVTRRAALTGVAVTATGLLLPRTSLAATNYLLPDTDVCALMPEVTEGPYYLDEVLVRRNIREDRVGVPVLVRMQVVDASCAPVPGARVDVWHCDAQGIYSSFGGGETGQSSTENETFLRGTQMADETGVVEFDTIYPGWYRGRTTHIHYKVWLNETNILTGQIFFPDALSEYLYQNAEPYLRDGERDTLNGNDSIAQQATHAAFAGITEEESSYLVQLIVGVDPNAVSHDVGMPGAMGLPPRNTPAGGSGAPSVGGPTGSRDGISLIPGVEES
ncbi:intradiol ring-cleavage dioxygenase [Pseudoruegeria sp. HB172150]|uniref:intradiol ring-cleavage dioxygenase n=1 Tax=Pseudoruegeria sp. HB172150 TaxID=2721164 RepID=UPI001556CB94|nr:intradiol ring-cleavage dioxygenase [Pseudoruegeria sp. HB172150]